MTDIRVVAYGLLQTFSEHGLLGWSDVHPALHLFFLYGESDERVRLAAALAVRALRSGSLCIEIASAPQTAAQWERLDGACLLYTSRCV